MSVLTPQETYDSAIRKGMLALKRRIQAMGPAELLMSEVQEMLTEITQHAREDKAMAVHDVDIVIKCLDCYGQGGMSIEAGDTCSWSECYACKATGFVPVEHGP